MEGMMSCNRYDEPHTRRELDEAEPRLTEEGSGAPDKSKPIHPLDIEDWLVIDKDGNIIASPTAMTEVSGMPERICIWDRDWSIPGSNRGWTTSYPDGHHLEYVRADLFDAQRDQMQAEIDRLIKAYGELGLELEIARAALREIATDPRDNSVCIGSGWDFYTDAVNYARAALKGSQE